MDNSSKTTTQSAIRAAGYETRANAYAGTCQACGAAKAAQAARIARKPGVASGQWQVVCKTAKCTSALIARRWIGAVTPGQWDSVTDE